MTILAGAGSPEEGSNFNPPTMGEFMKSQKISKLQVLRESRAGAAVIKEAHDFHQRLALKHGIETPRGLAHMRASRMFSKEAGMTLQEKFEQGGGDGTLDPKAVCKASKSAMMFHKKQAEKAGLDSDLGHAHTAAMEHHMDIMKKAKGQMGQQPQQPQGQMPQQPKQPKPQLPQPQPMQQSREGGPGSGRHKEYGAVLKKHGYSLSKTEKQGTEIWKKGKGITYLHPDGRWEHNTSTKYGERAPDGTSAKSLASHLSKTHGSKEAAPGASGKQSPMPVPKKSEMPNQDVRMPVPPVPLQRLQQGQNCDTPMKASKRIKRIDRFGEAAADPHSHDEWGERAGVCCDSPSGVNEQLGKDKIFYGRKPKPMKDNSGLTTKEAGEAPSTGSSVYVTPRYQNIKPEGEIDPRDVAKQGQKGGGHTGLGETSSRFPATMEGKKGWTERQRMMHSKIGRRIARSN